MKEALREKIKDHPNVVEFIEFLVSCIISMLVVGYFCGSLVYYPNHTGFCVHGLRELRLICILSLAIFYLLDIIITIKVLHEELTQLDRKLMPTIIISLSLLFAVQAYLHSKDRFSFTTKGVSWKKASLIQKYNKTESLSWKDIDAIRFVDHRKRVDEIEFYRCVDGSYEKLATVKMDCSKFPSDNMTFSVAVYMCDRHWNKQITRLWQKP